MDKYVEKFSDPKMTLTGSLRAHVTLKELKTLWFNTGTLCNLACKSCYIESSPTNDSLVYLSLCEIQGYLDEIRDLNLPVEEIGLTGGEPFMNPDIDAIMEAVLGQGFRLLILTNAMKPLFHHQEKLQALRSQYGEKIILRVSIDHYAPTLHEQERGANSWAPMLDGLTWLSGEGFVVHVAGRTFSDEAESVMREGYAAFFARENINVNANDPVELVLFPEMDAEADVAEITTDCWGITGVSPQSLMCASSRMVVKHKGAARPTLMACTLLAYDHEFDMGPNLATARPAVSLNHPHCARFCVLGGASCS